MPPATRDPPEWLSMKPQELIDRLAAKVSARIAAGDVLDPWEIVAAEWSEAVGSPLDRADDYHVMLAAAALESAAGGH